MNWLFRIFHRRKLLRELNEALDRRKQARLNGLTPVNGYYRRMRT